MKKNTHTVKVDLVCRVVWLSACLLLTVAPNHAASAENTPSGSRSTREATVVGRVQNVITGSYLKRARVAVKGTEQITFTDELGWFRMVDVPRGTIVIEVFYTGLDLQTIPLDVTGGGEFEVNVELTSTARYGKDPRVVVLDPLLVASNKETDATAFATNEQRFAPNLKNVVATDALGDVFGSNAGDFLKFLPGLVAEYDNADVRGISVRGIGADMTAVVVDGLPVTTGSQSGPTRAVNPSTLALNNLSRIEVTKVPTPADPADALAGSINMVSKRAFERKTGELRFGLNLAGNGNALTLAKTPHGYLDENTYKIQPGVQFDYTLPFGSNFGVVFTGMESNKFVNQDLSTTTWNTAGTGTGASIDRPYLQQFIPRVFPRYTKRSVYSLKADWRITPNSVLSIGGRWSRLVTARSGGFRLTADVGTSGTPAPASGLPLRFGPDFSSGATGRGAISLSGDWQYGKVLSFGNDLSYRLDNGQWRVEAAVGLAGGQPVLNPSLGPVYFSQVVAVLRNPVRVVLTGIGPNGPSGIAAFDSNNQPVDLTDVNNYVLSSALRQPRKQVTASRIAKADVRRRTNLFPFPAAVQVGVRQQYQSTDTRWEQVSLTPAPNLNPAPYLYRAFVNQELPGGFMGIPAINPGSVAKASTENPALFTVTPAQAATAERNRLMWSERAEETVSAAYLQGEVQLLKNRLRLLSGVRFEQTKTEGEGLLYEPNAVFVRNADGSYARNAQGARIRRPEAGAAGSMEEVLLTRKERGYRANRQYDGYYPSLHVTYEVKENLLARLAYARTYGRPDYPNIIPNATINDADLTPDQIGNPAFEQGTITVRNTGLKPWTANNYDFSIEYYSQTGGMLTAGLFRKDISNFFGSDVRVATAADLEQLGLDPKYIGWRISSQFNTGSARVSGVELSLRQNLRHLGAWGQYVTAFANATQLRLQGNAYASFQSFVPKTANGGLSFDWKRISIIPKLNYRGLNKLVAVPAFGPDAFRYIKARTIVDLNVVYRMTKQLSLTGTINNVFNDKLTTLVYGSQTPEYARQSLRSDYGAVFSLGVSGTY